MTICGVNLLTVEGEKHKVENFLKLFPGIMEEFNLTRIIPSSRMKEDSFVPAEVFFMSKHCIGPDRTKVIAEVHLTSGVVVPHWFVIDAAVAYPELTLTLRSVEDNADMDGTIICKHGKVVSSDWDLNA